MTLSTTDIDSLNAAERMQLINDGAEAPVALTVSMQKTACVLLHMIADRKLTQIRPIFVDTQFHFDETHEILQEYETLLQLPIRRIKPSSQDIADLETRFHTIAPFHHREGVNSCCDVRKVRPLLRELSEGYEGRIAGLMQSEGGQRESVNFIGFDNRLGPNFPVYHPLFDWSNDDVDSYLATHNLPIHSLYAKNYTSIGCFPCTTPLLSGETDPRAGRWRHLRTEDQTGKTYCNINQSDKKVGGGDGI